MGDVLLLDSLACDTRIGRWRMDIRPSSIILHRHLIDTRIQDSFMGNMKRSTYIPYETYLTQKSLDTRQQGRHGISFLRERS